MSLRVYLRELTHQDVTEEYLAFFKDDKVLNFLEVDGHKLTAEAVKNYMDHGRDTGTYFMYAICLQESDRHIGNLKVGPINQTHSISDLVCVIFDKSQWGKGLATEVISLGNRLAFEKYKIRKLHGQIYADNIGSIKAYCRAGWIIEGVIRGRYLVDGKPMDQVLVSCNNPKYLPPEQDDYNVRELQKMIALRSNFLG